VQQLVKKNSDNIKMHGTTVKNYKIHVYTKKKTWNIRYGFGWFKKWPIVGLDRRITNYMKRNRSGDAVSGKFQKALNRVHKSQTMVRIITPLISLLSV